MIYIRDLKKDDLVILNYGLYNFHEEPNSNSDFFPYKRGSIFLYKGFLLEGNKLFLELIDIDSCKIVYNYWSNRGLDCLNNRTNVFDLFIELNDA